MTGRVFRHAAQDFVYMLVSSIHNIVFDQYLLADFLSHACKMNRLRQPAQPDCGTRHLMSPK